MSDTIFDKIINDEVPSWKVWEDDNYLAFLTPFASTPGVTIVIPKSNPGPYIFDLENSVYVGLMEAVKLVAKKLENAFDTRIALVFEGTEVPYVHAKLYPMHNLEKIKENPPKLEPLFHEDYLGYINTHGGPMMGTEELDKLRDLIAGS